MYVRKREYLGGSWDFLSLQLRLVQAKVLASQEVKADQSAAPCAPIPTGMDLAALSRGSQRLSIAVELLYSRQVNHPCTLPPYFSIYRYIVLPICHQYILHFLNIKKLINPLVPPVIYFETVKVTGVLSDPIFQNFPRVKICR